MSSSSDTLDITPLGPFGLSGQGEPHDVSVAREPLDLSARDPQAAAAARARIANLPDVHGEIAPAAPVVVPQPAVPTVSTALHPLQPASVIDITPVATPTSITPVTKPLAEPVIGPVATNINPAAPTANPNPFLPTSAPVAAITSDIMAIPGQVVDIPAETAGPAQTPAPPTSPAEKPKRVLPSRTKPIAMAVGSFLLLLILFKSQVIFSQLTYLTRPKNPIVATAPASEVIAPDSVLNIPKINVSAPIIFEPSLDEAAIQKALEGGVVHYGSTPNPGQPGNSVIVGHSSNDWWEPGSYKFVFVLLDKLAVGDSFSLNYQSTKYIYQVSEIKVVEPTDLSVLAPTDQPSLTIITCTPPGTSWKRLVVVAHQTSPDPAAAIEAPTKTTTDSSSLPGNAPSWFDQVSRLWHSWFGGNKSDSSSTTPTTNPATALPTAK